ncbi:ABC transporter ATP-binding protein [Xinfangfangia sp. CPCC 101601]|uniref:ABC transporter ATP-binding protein n=1 Tax=Pseudogemmobacter lacusdianii TaxID=3069608 RepID=A0ABU0VT55_9RHOB|nr:ABC transporter ATP-binding protein [Xinfangfangia sp. CPCC 101601]MDQ2064914.1 ABC transporter ATP-binding protein [Xinfangfangia sp. CPCC 101601]
MAGITLRDLGYAAAGKVILAGLNLQLDQRRIAIIGRNGSGKTTLLRLIAGLVAPSHGAVTVEGIDPYRDRKGALQRIGILFQNPEHQILFPTVEEELAFGLRQQGMTQKDALRRTRDALAAEGRAHWAQASVSTLSGGQKQWLCLQAVLLMAPETILLDEPFSGLDLPAIARVTRRLEALPQRLITISHDPASAAKAERVIWLEAGRLHADGPADQVLPQFTAEMARIGEADADADLAG